MPVIQSEQHVTEILIVEDDRDDVLLLRDALSRCAFPRQLHTVPDGHQALEFLRRENEYSWAPRPDLIFLDLNMPRCNGYEVLSALKDDKDLAAIPVVVVSTSTQKADRERCLTLGAEAYLEKQFDFEKFCDSVFTIVDPAVASIQHRERIGFARNQQPGHRLGDASLS